MLGGNSDQINLRILQQFLVIVRCIGERSPVVCLGSAYASGSSQSPEFKLTGLFHDGQHGAPHKISRADQPQTDLISPCCLFGCLVFYCLSPFFLVIAVFQENADIPLMIRILRDHFIGVRRFLKGNLMSDQIREVCSLLRDQTHKLFNVAALCKADVTDGIIDTFLFISAVITSGAVRTGDPERQLTLIVRSAVNIHLGHADHTDDPPVSGNRRCQVHGLIGVGRRGDDHLIRSPSTGQSLCLVRRVVVIGIDESFQACPRHGLVHHIVGNHIASVSVQDPAEYMSHKPQADDCHGLARHHFRLMDSLQGNTAQRAERGLTVILQFLRHFRQHRAADAVDLTVICGAYHRHQIPCLYFCHAFAAGDDPAYSGITHGHRLCQLIERALHRGDNAVRRKLFQHLLYLVRTLQRFLDQILSSKGSKPSLRSRADHGIQAFHQRHILFYRRHGLVQQLHASVLYVQK